MKQLETIAQMREERRKLAGRKIGLVPTMGYLHDGHLSLVRRARSACDVVIMSIFVNPLQFGPQEDYARYPRDLQRDCELAQAAGVDILFTPSVTEMYPETPLAKVSVAQISDPLCGRSRPGHFDGVATVVMKLFNIVQPDAAYFGLKDAQQVAVIERMVRDLNVPVEIVACPIVREADGLALSSRNVYLTPEERKQATVLYKTLQAVERRIRDGERDVAALKDFMFRTLREAPLAEIDYAEILTYPGLQPLATLGNERAIVALAVKFGQTRLIDNMIVSPEGERRDDGARQHQQM
ncbi:pantoate--beta-alanine ligase [Bacillaceae bacterium]